MNWILITICLVYVFTVGLTARYKEQSIEYREKMLKADKEFQEELVKMLVLIEQKDARIEELERQFC